MPINRVKMDKDSAEGFEVEANPNTDALDARGLYVQNDSSNDASVLVTRDASDNLTFQDGFNASPVSLSSLMTGGSGITAAQHKVLRQLIHLAEEGGPFEGFASGAYQETLPSASPFPTSVVWWESAAKLKKIAEETITYNTNKTINTDQWKVYDTDGTTVLVTATDAISYSGVFETSRTRTLT